MPPKAIKQVLKCTSLKEKQCADQSTCKWDTKKNECKQSFPVAKANIGKILNGPDGKQYISKPDKRGAYRWQIVRKSEPLKTPKVTSTKAKSPKMAESRYPEDFQKFAEYHGLPADKWDFVYKHGVFGDFDWSSLKNMVMYWPQANEHDLSELTTLGDDKLGELYAAEQFNKVLKHVDKTTWKRGDIIFPYSQGYRDTQKVFWDGTKAINSEGEYGGVPKTFAVPGEFPPNYWNPLMEYSTWVPVQFDVEVAKDLNARCTSASNKEQVFEFTFQDRTWALVTTCEKPPLSKNGKGFWYPCPWPPVGQRDYDFIYTPRQLKPYLKSGVAPENVMFL